MNTITRSAVRKIEEGGTINLALVMVTGDGIVVDEFDNTELSNAPVTFINGKDLDDQIKTAATNMHNSVSAEATPYTINRNFITNGLSKITVIIKATELDFETKPRFYIEDDNDFYKEIYNVL